MLRHRLLWSTGCALTMVLLLAVGVVQAGEPIVVQQVGLQGELSLSDFLPTPPERVIPIQNTTINLNPGGGIGGNAPALAAFNRAAQNWQSVLADPVVLNINIDMASLGAGILGSTISTSYYSSFNTIRNLVSGGTDTGSAAEAATLAYLPTSAQFSARVPIGFGIDAMSATRANLLALGVPQSSLGGLGTSDGSITFSTNFTWDYDDSDGVTAGAFSFESVATHEIGHALGFISEVDDVDRLLDQGATTPSLRPTPLDLFRFAIGDVPVTSAAFTNNPRDLVPGGTDYFSYLDGNIQMSTGRYYGDGRQASHWKDDLGLGLMDPTLAPGEMSLIGYNDLVAMDLIGWQIVPEPATLGLLALGMLAMIRRRRNK